MSASLLGPLPQFSQKRPASTSSRSTSLDFGSTLDDLLGDDDTFNTGGTSQFASSTTPKYGTKASSAPKLKSNTGKVPSLPKKIKVKSVSEDDFDQSPDVPVTEEDKAKIVGSIRDIDDMESNLFSSLGRAQSKKSAGKANKTKSSVPKKVSFEDEEFDEQEQELMREINKGLAATTKPSPTSPPKPQPKENNTKHKSVAASLSDDDDDDILADLLLSGSEDDDDDDDNQLVNNKPKLKLASSKTQPATTDKGNSKPVVESGLKQQQQQHQQQQQQQKQPSKVMADKRKPTPSSSKQARGLHNSDDEFEGDDILGLIDSTPQKANQINTRRASRFDELMGRKQLEQQQQQEQQQHQEAEEHISLSTDHNVSENVDGTSKTTEKENKVDNFDFQFGGYLPSSVSSGGGGRKTKGLPQGRRIMSDTSALERPSTAPGKKSVRFSDSVESVADLSRPSSTPSMKGCLKQDTGMVGHQSKQQDSNRDHVMTDPITEQSTLTTTETTKPPSEQVSVKSSRLEEDLFVVERPPTGNRRRREVASIPPKSPLSGNPFEVNTLTISHEPSANELLPQNKPHPQDILQPPVTSRQNEACTTTPNAAMMHSTVTTLPDVALQQQLVQQQLLIQQQSLQLQQVNNELAATKLQLEQARASWDQTASQEREKLNSEVIMVKEQLKTLQEELREEKSTTSRLKLVVTELEKKLSTCEEEKMAAVKNYEAGQQQSRQQSDAHHKEMADTTVTIDDLKMKLHRVELERDQLQHTLQLSQQRHNEEIESIEKSHSSRIANIEEAHQRREQRWGEEQEMQLARHSEQLKQLEQEKMDSVIMGRKKLETLEASKNNEIEKLQSLHRSSVGDVHREHELEIQHLKTIHEQEVAALKAAFSHTRALTDLTRQVEASSREVSSLQQRVDKAHNLGLGQREEVLKCREEQLKVNERRLVEQQVENEAERVRLQTLIGRMESSLSDQARQLEQERWKLQQDSIRLNSQQAAFDQDRTSFSARMEQERADLQAAKDQFLAEQREMMSKCYEEHRTVASEQSKLSSSLKLSKEKELRETERILKREKVLKSQLEQVQQESARLAEEHAQLNEDKQRQESHHRTLQDHEMAVTERDNEAVRKLQQAKEMHEMATKMYQQGQRSLEEAQLLKGTAESQLASVQSQQMALQKQEKHLTEEKLNFARERKEQTQGRLYVPDLQVDSITNDVIKDDVILPQFDHMTQAPPPQSTRPHMTSLLDQLDTNIQLRKIAMEAEQDNEFLEEEKNFLASLRNSGKLTLLELESSYS